MDAITPKALQEIFRQLDIDSPVRSVTIEEGTLIIRTAWETIEVAHTTPAPSPGHDDTLPKPTAVGGPEAAATGPDAANTLPTDTAHCPLPTDDCPLPTAVLPTDNWPLPTASLDDYTAIDGVGPVTAQQLHDLELYTYDDLRSLFARLTTAQTTDLGIRERTRAQIEGWLAKHLM